MASFALNLLGITLPAKSCSKGQIATSTSFHVLAGGSYLCVHGYLEHKEHGTPVDLVPSIDIECAVYLNQTFVHDIRRDVCVPSSSYFPSYTGSVDRYERLSWSRPSGYLLLSLFLFLFDGTVSPGGLSLVDFPAQIMLPLTASKINRMP